MCIIRLNKLANEANGDREHIEKQKQTIVHKKDDNKTRVEDVPYPPIPIGIHIFQLLLASWYWYMSTLFIRSITVRYYEYIDIDL